MALATRCTACTTIFRISTAQAAVKGGMVRCGICGNVFNSLDALVRVEELDVVEEVVIVPPGAGAGAGAAAAAAAAAAEPADAAALDDEPDFDPDRDAHVLPVDPYAATSVDDDRAEPSFLQDKPVIGEWWLPSAEEDAIARRTETRVGHDLAPFIAEPREDIEPESPAEGTNPVFMRPQPAVERGPRGMRWMLGLLTLAAALTLLGQVAYLSRDELAARWSPARPWLATACSYLGCVVGYPAHAESVTIESASVQTTGATSNVYVMTALLRNRDSIDVRYPHLELVLTDLQDQPILRRDLAPDDYVTVGRPSSTGFPAQSELPIRVAFELNNLRFAGYRINQFYP